MGREHQLDGLGFLGGYILGMMCGALSGFWLARRTSKQLIQARTTQSTDDEQ